MERSLKEIPAGCWQQIDPHVMREQWSNYPKLLEMLDEYIEAMSPGDELWLFDYCSWTGIAIRRGNVAVKNRLYMHRLIRRNSTQSGSPATPPGT